MAAHLIFAVVDDRKTEQCGRGRPPV